MSDNFIGLRQLVIPSAISIAASYQLANFARSVGKARTKFKVSPPATDGDEGFVRVFRAQQNCLEFAPIFYPTVWVSSIFFHPELAAIASIGYLYARHQYFEGYSRSVEDRRGPFMLSAKFLKMLIAMSVAGLASFALKEHFGIDIPGRVLDVISKYSPLSNKS